jgi:hypothetical protein
MGSINVYEYWLWLQWDIKLPMYRCARNNLEGKKSLGPLKISLEMAHKVICPQKKISRIFKISGTLIVIVSNPLYKSISV